MDEQHQESSAFHEHEQSASLPEDGGPSNSDHHHQEHLIEHSSPLKGGEQLQFQQGESEEKHIQTSSSHAHEKQKHDGKQEENQVDSHVVQNNEGENQKNQFDSPKKEQHEEINSDNQVESHEEQHLEKEVDSHIEKHDHSGDQIVFHQEKQKDEHNEEKEHRDEHLEHGVHEISQQPEKVHSEEHEVQKLSPRKQNEDDVQIKHQQVHIPEHLDEQVVQHKEVEERKQPSEEQQIKHQVEEQIEHQVQEQIEHQVEEQIEHQVEEQKQPLVEEHHIAIEQVSQEANAQLSNSQGASPVKGEQQENDDEHQARKGVEEEVKEANSLPEQINEKQAVIKQYQASLDEANFLKTQGNNLVKTQMYHEAILKYQDALTLCQPYYLMQCPDELIKQFLQMRVQCVGNLSLCYLNVNELALCIEKCNEALRDDPKNVKACFRLSQAYEKRGDWEESWEAIKKACSLQRAGSGDVDRPLLEQYHRIKEQYERTKGQQKQKQKELYSKMFNSEQKLPTPPPPQAKEEEPGSTHSLDRNSANSSRINNEGTGNHYALTSLGSNSSMELALPFSAQQLVVSGTVAALLASSITKFVLEERLNTHEGFVQSLVIGGSALSAILMKKTWQKLSFGAVTAGTIFILLVNKSRRR